MEDHPEMTELMEVVLDLGRPPLARFPAGACLAWGQVGGRGSRGLDGGKRGRGGKG